ncbi:hypothetical protein Taro_005168 [Colocasia esculenta]|uniref:Uncharacterized protein n=1 Tax=Colocasia esculenta TaxID=4460 RepID=A0A843TX11_COLES|nr:hypothetical protein [Colocasia esculenta]
MHPGRDPNPESWNPTFTKSLELGLCLAQTGTWRQCLDAKISSVRPAILPSNSLNGQTLPSSSSVQNIFGFTLASAYRLIGFWPKVTLASTSGRRGGVNVQTWTPILTQASSDVDVNLSDLHAQQSCCLLRQGMATHWGMSPNGSKARRGEERKTLEHSVRKPHFRTLKSDPLELDLEIYCNKEEAEAKEKASPSSPRRGDHPGTRRKAILEALLQLLGTAQGAYRLTVVLTGWAAGLLFEELKEVLESCSCLVGKPIDKADPSSAKLPLT